ncbi:hypothetical protein OSB04_010406 [Centaurea solstitialis]|uniref:Uncharacterized protein n=1 Tax=Centaurea solstitialis TaxID=347529 RepID=A0AA38TQK9_9ASTR|nr:hypothetical protein OSB04_010406 [Centaurea solstitialis]
MAESLYSSSADLLSGFLEAFPSLVQGKIRLAFGNLHDDLIGLIQFWAPVKIGSRCLLTTYDQPFLQDDEKDTEMYRLRCVKYKYNVDHVNKVEDEDDEDRTNIISSGAPAAAFLNEMPEFFGNMTVDDPSPLASFAVKCGLGRTLVLPVFYPSQRCCVGVVECCSSLYLSLIDMYDDLNAAFQVCIVIRFDDLKLVAYTPNYVVNCGKATVNYRSYLPVHTVHMEGYEGVPWFSVDLRFSLKLDTRKFDCELILHCELEGLPIVRHVLHPI